MGFVHVGIPSNILPVYFAQNVGPDILEMRSKEWHIQVRANLVMHPDGNVIRPLKTYELLAM